MRLGIVGNGVVGNATARAFEGFAEVRITDRIRAKETHQLSDVLKCDLIFLCLPTPQKIGELTCDTSAIDDFFNWGMPEQFRQANYVLRSTVPIGYTKRLAKTYNLHNLVHSPEFLTARTAVEDAASPTRLLIGYEPIEYIGLPPAAESLYRLYANRWSSALIHCMTSDESEAVKLFQNSFSAVKIAYFNEIRSLSDRLGLDWERCMKALLAGGWINPMHTQVPGPDGKRGFGGTCLPKDLANLMDCMFSSSVLPHVCSGAHDRNRGDRPRDPN